MSGGANIDNLTSDCAAGLEVTRRQEGRREGRENGDEG
jgi:hypothetical protein